MDRNQSQRQRISEGARIVRVFGGCLLVVLLVFVPQNVVPTDLTFFGWTFTLPLGLAMLGTALGGALIVALFGSVPFIRTRRRARKLQKERDSFKRFLM